MVSAKWHLEHALGEGSTGQVWLAKSPEGTRVAVKLLPSRELFSVWEHEVGLLMRMRHPAIASILGCVRDSSEIFGKDSGPCFWMEYVAGDDLLTAAQRYDRDPVLLKDWLVQGLQALAYLHSQNVLHGDLSPGNLRIADQGLKLIDFGTASLSGSNRASRAATLLYLAPERISGKNSPACDLFSLGTLFYEALSGVHPRAGCRSLSEMVRKPALPLSEVRADLAKSDPVLARTIDRMILTDPSQRFSDAGEVLESLSGRSPDTRSSRVFHPITMFGTTTLIEKITEALEGLESRSRLFVLHGATGVGKKRFLRETGFQCALAGHAVKEWEASRFRQGIESLTASKGAHFFRSLEDVPASDLSLLLKVDRKRIPSAGVMIVWEWNDDGVNAESRRILEIIAARPDVTELKLENLTADDTRDLVRAALSGSKEAEIDELAARLYRSTGGNPRLLLERLQSPSAVDFRDVLRGRLKELSDLERNVLQFLATASGPVEADALFRVVGGEVLETVLALDRLSGRGLVALETENGRYRLGISGLKEAVLENLSEAQSVALHRAWWESFAPGGEGNQERLHHALALGDARYVADWAHPVIESLWKQRKAEAALSLTDKALPIVKNIPNEVEVSKLLRMKVNLLNELGRYAETLALCEEILRMRAADEPFELKTVKYWLITGLGNQNVGRPEEAERRFRKCLEECDRFEPKVPRSYAMRCHSLIGMEALRRGDLTEARAQFEAGLSFSDYRGWRRAEICRNLAAVTHQEKDTAGALALLAEARALYAEESNREGVYATWLQEGNLGLEREDFASAAKAYAEAEAIAKSLGDDLLLASVWNNQGILERRRGDLAASLESLQKALAVFRPLGNWVDLAESLKQNALTEISVGRFEEADAKIAEIRNLASRLSQAKEKADEAQEMLLYYRDGMGLKAADESAKQALLSVYARLPKALKIRFEERFDYKKWILNQSSQGKDGQP